MTPHRSHWTAGRFSAAAPISRRTYRNSVWWKVTRLPVICMGGSGGWTMAAASPHGGMSCGVPEHERDTRANLRRRPRPAGSHGDHIAPLPLSFGYIEDHCTGHDPWIQDRGTGRAGATVPYLGQLGPAPLVAAGRAPTPQVEADHP